MGATILLVEDEAGLRMTLNDRLRSEGYRVETASDGEQGFEWAVGGGFDLIVLDVMMPRKNGFDVCRDLRQLGVDVPILMLTARGQTADKVLGLKIGADDYLTKPFEMPELLARVEALLRRQAIAPPTEAPAFAFGDVQVDFRRTEVRREGQVVQLSAKEFQLPPLPHRKPRHHTFSRNSAVPSVGLRSGAVDSHGRCPCRVAASKAGA